MTTTRGRLHYRSLLTFYYAGFQQCSLCDWRHGLGLREGSGLLGSSRGNFFSRRRAGFISFAGQLSRLPVQYKIGGQPRNIIKYQVLLGKGFHLQARPDDSHGRSTNYASGVYKPGLGGRLFFSLSRYWFFGTSSRARFWPAFHGRHLRLDNSCRPLCHLRHKFFYGGGWTAARPLSPSHLLTLDQQAQRVESPARTQNSSVNIHNTTRQVLDYSTRGAYLLRRSLVVLQFLGDALERHIAWPPRQCKETRL
jgi:hypothetical protein